VTGLVDTVNELEADVPKGHVEFYLDPQSDFPGVPFIYEYGKETHLSYVGRRGWIEGVFSGEKVGVRHVKTPGEHVYEISYGRTYKLAKVAV
jgi:hypothetical protein